MHHDRLSEWFVPKFGSRNFRLSVGILFLPYTGMVISFVIWGSLSVEFSVERIFYICLVYFLAVGVAAHCLDALGSKRKPWGDISKTKLWIAAIVSMIVSFSIGLYFVFLDSWLLLPIGLFEIFFLFAYNLELFGGKLHNNISFIISWGILPVFAGAAIQFNSISEMTVLFSIIAGLLSYLQIKTSRKYKTLKKINSSNELYQKKEIILKTISILVIGGTISLFVLISL